MLVGILAILAATAGVVACNWYGNGLLLLLLLWSLLPLLSIHCYCNRHEIIFTAICIAILCHEYPRFCLYSNSYGHLCYSPYCCGQWPW